MALRYVWNEKAGPIEHDADGILATHNLERKWDQIVRLWSEFLFFTRYNGGRLVMWGILIELGWMGLLCTAGFNSYFGGSPCYSDRALLWLVVFVPTNVFNLFQFVVLSSRGYRPFANDLLILKLKSKKEQRGYRPEASSLDDEEREGLVAAQLVYYATTISLVLWAFAGVAVFTGGCSARPMSLHAAMLLAMVLFWLSFLVIRWPAWTAPSVADPDNDSWVNDHAKRVVARATA
mmetsp:Transcript_56654/g.124231  ORF Transcript_56654/g.124231 Transcript_56654/m.124231 type:complete len:235 (+) Transcript_56654:96-800(+)